MGQNPLSEDQIEFVQTNLIRTISLLSHIGDPDIEHHIRYFVANEVDFDRRLLSLTEETLSDLLPDLLLRDRFWVSLGHFTAPILNEGEDPKLHSGQRMPFQGPSQVQGQGMNGDDVGDQRVRVVKKTLSKTTASDEIDILRHLRDTQAKEEEERDVYIHLCTCISTVTDSSGLVVHSLSLCASSSLKSHFQNITGEEHIMDCLAQIRGIAGAIEFLHRIDPTGSGRERYCYCHMDLKPDNIVVFLENAPSPVGVWKVIDFGISKYRRTKKLLVGTQGRYNQRITFTMGTETEQLRGIYQPPEVNRPGKVMGRRSDIWSLGCVFSEVLATNLGTLDMLRAQLEHYTAPPNDGFPYFFYQERRFRYWGVPPKYKMNTALRRWLDELPSGSYAYSGTLSECAGIIEEMLAITRTKRLRSDRLLGRLDGLLGTHFW
ncbi:kinase-like protein [Hypomontagnella monticulosa]|nr:kinase-like protein [Hypomontagnella monticulosa]